MATKNVHRAYYQGKLVAYMKKNGVALRYKLYRIDKQYLTRYFRVSPKVEGYEIINERIDTLESKIDKTISSLFLEDPKMVITASIIDNAIAEQEKEVKEVEKRKTVSECVVVELIAKSCQQTCGQWVCFDFLLINLTIQIIGLGRF
jgi:hypothetical protein